MKVIINFSKRWLYTFIAIGILAIIVVGVYAINTNEGWHPASQIDFSGGITTPIITSDEICIGSDCKSSWPSGGGITEEVDPTVPGWAKGNLCVCVQCENRYGQRDSAKCATMGSWTSFAGANKYPLYYCRIRLYTC